MTLRVCTFEELGLLELYRVLQLRSEVFVVEQTCAYQDIDGKDPKALHVLGEYEGEIVAYTRLFRPGDYFEEASIGRVVIDPRFRSRKWGYPLMEASLQAIADRFGETHVTISAQLYLKLFYENAGFTAVGEVYPEDDIPHIRMVRR